MAPEVQKLAENEAALISSLHAMVRALETRIPGPLNVLPFLDSHF